MDKSCPSTGESTVYSTKSINPLASLPLAPSTTTSSGSSKGDTSTKRDQYLRHLNKLSHRISKPTTATTTTNTALVRKPSFESPNPIPHRPETSLSQSLAAQQQQNQPPVYNINKDDFRDVVQKLTGSPAHERISNPTTQPPPIQPSKPSISSRLQRIRPPPLSQITNRPSPLMNSHMRPQIGYHPAPIGHVSCGFSSGSGFVTNIRPQGAPLSPLPPLPSCHAPAESPISAYMRFLQSSVAGTMGADSDPKRFSSNPPPLPPPKYRNQASVNYPLQNQLLVPPQGNQQSAVPPSSSSASLEFLMPPPPSSPLAFGCFPSPKSPCPLFSPTLPFSPTGTGQFGFSSFSVPPSVPPVPSPK